MRASAITFQSIASACAPTSPLRARSTRSTSRSSSSCASRQRLPSSTTASGSSHTVAPLPDTSCTMPFIWPRMSALTGIT